MIVPRGTNVFLPCWGEKHINLLKNCLGVSLKWPKNNKAIAGSNWIIISDSKKSYDQISLIVKDIDQTSTSHAVIEDKIKYNSGPILLKVLKDVIQSSLQNQTSLLMATPDYIYGDGTIENLKKIGTQKGTCVSFAHMRVLPKILDNILKEVPFNNNDLIRLALKYQHATWADSEESANPGRTYFGGISWEYLNETKSLIGVRHRLPAPFFANFLEEDLTFFSTYHNHPHDGTFALWDHLWPSHLIKAGRLRYVGSSDAATMIEVTDKEENIPPINPYGITNKDDYGQSNLQNQICKQFISIFRC